MRRALLLFGGFGALVFGAAFLLSFFNPLLVEQAAREAIRLEVQRTVAEKVDSLTQSRIIALAQKSLGQTDAEIEAARKEIANGVPAKVANVVANMLNANCACRKRLVEGANRQQEERITSLGHVRERRADLIEHAYATVSASLLREVQIFTGSNACAFALLTLVTCLRKGAALQLALPAIVLVGAVAVSAGFYLFHQAWLHTILYGEYVGMAYTAYLGGVAVFLGDVAFNRARRCTQVVNVVMAIVGSAFTAIPC